MNYQDNDGGEWLLLGAGICIGLFIIVAWFTN